MSILLVLFLYSSFYRLSPCTVFILLFIDFPLIRFLYCLLSTFSLLYGFYTTFYRLSPLSGLFIVFKYLSCCKHSIKLLIVCAIGLSSRRGCCGSSWRDCSAFANPRDSSWRTRRGYDWGIPGRCPLRRRGSCLPTLFSSHIPRAGRCVLSTVRYGAPIFIPTSRYIIELFASRYFQHAHFIPIVGVGKRGVCILICPW